MSFWKVITPEEVVNVFENPSIETDTSGYAAVASNTIARSVLQQFRGAFSLLCTIGGAANRFWDRAITLSTSTTYTITLYLRVPSGWDGGNIIVDANNFTGATITTVDIFTSGTTVEDQWVRLETRLVTAADATGEISLEYLGSPTVGKTVNVDALQIEENDHATTYCDGDQDQCFWLFERHLSQSRRKATARSGGKINDIVDDLGLQSVRQFPGMGMADPLNILIPLGQLDGSLYQTTKQQTRDADIAGQIFGGSVAGFHQKRQLLNGAFSHELLKDKRPFTFRYTGTGITKEIHMLYSGGLQLQRQDGFSEALDMRFTAPDPFWSDLEEDGAVLAFNASLASFNRFVERDVDGVYGNTGATFNSNALKLKYSPVTKELHAVGAFTTPSNRVAKLDSSGTWVGIAGTDANAIARTMAFGHNGDLFVAGDFTLMNGVANTVRIAQFDQSTGAWLALGTGLNGICRELIAADNGDIYAAGSFTLAGGVANTVRIAKWDGSVWTALGNGVDNNNVFALTFDGDGNLIVGGSFTAVDGGTTANNLAKWNINTSAWQVFSDEPNNEVRELLTLPNGKWVMGGNFTQIGSDTFNAIATFNGNSFDTMADGLSAAVDGLSVDNETGYIFASGTFALSGSLALTAGVAVWRGGDWFNLGMKPVTPVAALDIEVGPDGAQLAISFDGGGATAVIPGATTVTNSGTARAYPILQLTGPMRVFRLDELLHGQTIFFDITLLDEEVAILDLRPSPTTEERGKTFSSNFRGNILDAIQAGGDLATFALYPGANNIALYVDGDAGNTDAVMWWRIRYDSIDGGG